MSPLERAALTVSVSGAIALALGLAFCSPAHSAQIVTTQSNAPWTIGQCDRAWGHGVIRARAVFNASSWNAGGWPLWNVTCWY